MNRYAPASGPDRLRAPPRHRQPQADRRDEREPRRGHDAIECSRTLDEDGADEEAESDDAHDI